MTGDSRAHRLYQPAGNLTAFTDGDGTTSYTDNAVNLVTDVTEPDGATTTFAYDDANNRLSTAYPNELVQAHTYDATGRITGITATKGTTRLTDLGYDYTDAGGVDTMLRHTVTALDPDTGDTHTTVYGYDSRDRLVAATTTDSSAAVVDDYGSHLGAATFDATILGV